MDLMVLYLFSNREFLMKQIKHFAFKTGGLQIEKKLVEIRISMKKKTIMDTVLLTGETIKSNKKCFKGIQRRPYLLTFYLCSIMYQINEMLVYKT